MTSSPSSDRIRSIRQRLRDRARERNEDFQFVLDRFAVERMLYRLSMSPYRQQFLLKGAMLFAIWFDAPHRPTRDADFLGHGAADPQQLMRIVHDLCAIELDDGLQFDMASVAIDAIREGSHYQGLRMRLCAQEAITVLGIANSRMKDYFDLLALTREGEMAKPALVAAINATFERRGTRWSPALPFGLSETFAGDPRKQAQWTAFLRRNRLQAEPLDAVVRDISAYVRALKA